MNLPVEFPRGSPMFKTVYLPAETWAKIVRRLTLEVGADDESRKWGDLIHEQTSGPSR